jgi:hypothetical protein
MKHYRRSFLFYLAILALTLPSASAMLQRVPVPAGTQLLVRLDNTISSKTSKVGDQFTATVLSPRTYGSATLQGHVSQLDKSGRLQGKTELGLDFDRIQLRNGRSARLNAELLEVRQSDKVKVVDEEGQVHSGSRGKQAIKRSTIGAAIGGVLGGLIGGGKGVAIGLIIGAGAGAGSLVVDGSKELKLEPGTEMLIRVGRNTR